jgi:hypothetical protein
MIYIFFTAGSVNTRTAPTERLQARSLRLEKLSDGAKTFMYIQAPMDILQKEAEEYKKRHELKDYFLNVKGKEYVN